MGSKLEEVTILKIKKPGVPVGALVSIMTPLLTIGIALFAAFAYITGIIAAFHVHTIFGLLAIVPPFGLVEGYGNFFFHYDVAQALRDFFVANGMKF